MQNENCNFIEISELTNLVRLETVKINDTIKKNIEQVEKKVDDMIKQYQQILTAVLKKKKK